MSTSFLYNKNNDHSNKVSLEQSTSYKKQRQQKKRAVLIACSGFLIMSLGLPFIEGVSLFNWLMVISSIVAIWALMWLILFFKLDSYLTFDPNFLFIPSVFSALLICILIHILPDLRLLLLSGWYVILVFGAGMLSLKNVLILNAFMIVGHLINILLLISSGEELTFTNEIGLLMPYIVIWSFLGIILEQIRKHRNENKKMRKMLSHLLIKKDQLLSDVSHELATPLTVLKLQVEALKDNIEEDVYATYDSLDVKLSDLEQLIKDIQLFSLSDSGGLKLDFKEFNLKAVLNEWQLEMEFSVSGSNLEFKFINNIPTKLTVNFDKNKLKQVLINIIANSVKYTDSPGCIQFEGKIVNNKLNLIVEDSAPNIHDTHLKKIFERLYRVDNSRSRDTGGSGLGLAICKSLVEAHKGTIWASQSQLGGLQITIELPIND